MTDVRRIQPHGPYVLVGHSLGCHIALEVARQLEIDGEHVDLVAMLDPWLPPSVVRAARREMPDMALPMGEMVETDFKSWWAYQKTVPLAGLFFGGKQRQVAAIADVGAMTGVRYRPRSWAGRALVVMSHLNRDDPRLWPRILTGELTIRRRECDHHSIVREPHIAAVLEMINEALERRSESIDHA